MTRLTPEAKKPARIDWKRSFDEAEEKRHKAERQLAAVTAERDALKVDAARYRLLRRGQRWSVINGIGDALRADDLDAAIDAARAK